MRRVSDFTILDLPRPRPFPCAYCNKPIFSDNCDCYGFSNMRHHHFVRPACHLCYMKNWKVVGGRLK